MDKKNYKEERFDSYLNKIIILSSKGYFKKQMNIVSKERNVSDNEDYSTFLQGVPMINSAFTILMILKIF